MPKSELICVLLTRHLNSIYRSNISICLSWPSNTAPQKSTAIMQNQQRAVGADTRPTRPICGAALLGGIGLTLSVFIAEPVFSRLPEIMLQARRGIIWTPCWQAVPVSVTLSPWKRRIQ
jgi:hypothetical protein